jgi:CRP-like cAMP-binding protein
MNLDELRKIAVLQALDDAALTDLAGALEERECADGQTIFAEGDPGDAMFFIGAGAVRIEKETGVDASGRKVLAVLGAGDYFGEMSLFDRKPRSASAVAAGPTRLLRLSQAAFDALPKEGSRVGMSVLFAMIRTSGERIRRLNAQVIVYDEIGKAIGESESLEQLLEVVLRQLCRATLADWGLVALRAQFSDRIEVRGTVNLQLTAAQREEVTTGKSILAQAMGTPREQLVRNLAEEDAFKSCAQVGFETPALLLAPIQVQSQSLGLILLGGQQPGQFDPNDLNLARGVARQAAQAIVNARHREEEKSRARHGRQFVRF